nr:threonine synthase [Cryptomonas paramecium]
MVEKNLIMNGQFYTCILHFYIGVITKLIFYFFPIFIRKKNYFFISSIMINFSNSINQKLMFSSIGIFFFEILKNKFGSKIVIYQLIKQTFDKKLYFILFNQNLFELTHFKHSSRVLDFFFQIFIDNRQKIFQIVSLVLFGNLTKQITLYKLYKKLYTFRIFFSGCSLKNRKKLKFIFRNRLDTLKKTFNVYSLSFSFFFFSELMRFDKVNYYILFDIFLNKKLFDSYEKTKLMVHLVNFSNVNILYEILKKINISLTDILKRKNGYLLILKLFYLSSFGTEYTKFLKIFFKFQHDKPIGFFYVLLIFLNRNSGLFDPRKYPLVSMKNKMVSIFLSMKYKNCLYKTMERYLNEFSSYKSKIDLAIENFFQKIDFSKKFKKNIFYLIFTKKYLYLPHSLTHRITNFPFIQFMSSVKKISSFCSKIYLLFFSFMYIFLHKKVIFFKKSFLRRFFLSFSFDKKIKINYKFFFIIMFVPIKTRSVYLLNISYPDWISK